MDNRQREMIHTLMNQHSKPMVQAAYRRIGDWHLAEDLVQETFLTACWKANQICSHTNPTAWLYKTLNTKQMECGDTTTHCLLRNIPSFTNITRETLWERPTFKELQVSAIV